MGDAPMRKELNLSAVCRRCGTRWHSKSVIPLNTPLIPVSDLFLAECPVCRPRPAGDVLRGGRATHLTQSGIRLLNDWGATLRRMFPGEVPYLVGSALVRADHRDVDVRVMLADDAFDALVRLVNLPDLALCVSLWGQQVTGLAIDFQVQRRSDANQEYSGRRRHPLAMVFT